MQTIQILLDTAQKVKEFVVIAQKYAFDIDLRNDRYTVDAKSILGIFSLDLSKAITLEAYSDDCTELMADLNKFKA